MHIKYLSYGLFEDGGYFHELNLWNSLISSFERNSEKVDKEIVRDPQFYTSFFDYFKLLRFANKHAKADVTITVSRMALNVIKKNTGKTIIIFHNYDKNDGKSKLFKKYLYRLFKKLSVYNKKNVCIVVPAEYWKEEFEKLTNKNIPIFVFPNFFKLIGYNKFSHLATVKHSIHLGMWSSKNDPQLFELAERLSQLGYKCFFSTPNEIDRKETLFYDVVYFENHDQYLKELSKANYTLAWPKVREGWGRVAHESVLCNTTLIGKDIGGLGQLLKESGQIICQNKAEIVDHIRNEDHPETKKEFIQKYSKESTDAFLKPIVEWVKS